MSKLKSLRKIKRRAISIERENIGGKEERRVRERERESERERDRRGEERRERQER
jgi:hypothetical protein